MLIKILDKSFWCFIVCKNIQYEINLTLKTILESNWISNFEFGEIQLLVISMETFLLVLTVNMQVLYI